MNKNNPGYGRCERLSEQQIFGKKTFPEK